MVWLYLGCLLLTFPNGLPFPHKPTDGIRFFYQTYTEFSAISPFGLVLYVAGIALFIFAAMTFYQLLGLYEQGKIFSEANVKLFRRLGWLAVGHGIVFMVLEAYFYGLPSFDPWSGARLQKNIWELLMRSFFALLSSPWIMGGLFLLTISHVMLKGRKLQEEQELTV
jgi:hypothetical protein